MRLIKRTDAALLAAIALAVVLVIFASVVLGDQVTTHMGAFQDLIRGLGPWGAVIFVVALIVGTSLLLPESVFAVAAGVLFGLTWGMGIVVVANLMAASFQYALARGLFRRRVQHAVDCRPSFVAIQHAVMKDQMRLQFLLRLTPLNPATISYLLGATGVRFSTFLITCAGLLPHLLLEVYLGHAGSHLVQAGTASGRAAHGHGLLLGGGLVVGIAAIVIISRIARKAVRRAVEIDESS